MSEESKYIFTTPEAAENLAALVDDLRVDKILPDPFDERIAPAVAAAVSHFTKS